METEREQNADDVEHCLLYVSHVSPVLTSPVFRFISVSKLSDVLLVGYAAASTKTYIIY